MTEKHVHDCTGPDGICPCGYKLHIPRFSFSVEVYDNETKSHILNETFMCDDLGVIEGGLEDALGAVRG